MRCTTISAANSAAPAGAQYGREWTTAFAVLAVLLQCLLAGFMQSGAAMAATMPNFTAAAMPMHGDVPAMPAGRPCCQDCMSCTPLALSYRPPDVVPATTVSTGLRTAPGAPTTIPALAQIPYARGPPPTA
jgi:hypothetical protein